MVKRIILVAVASFLLSLVSSCQKEVGLKSSNNVTIHATIASNEPSTRTAVSDDGKVSWIPGDDIFVFKASDFQEGGYVDAYSFESDLSSPSYSASFTGNMTVDEDETYFAFYPGSWSTVDSYWGTDEPGSMYNPFDGYLSPEQSESYDGDLNGNALLAAYSDGSIDNIRFMNVCSGLKFSLSETGFTEISIKGNNSEAIAGAFTLVDFDPFEDTPVVNPADGASKVAKMSAISGSMLPNEWLYLVIFPQTFENGITISFKKEGLPAGSVVINGPLEFKRGVWKKAENIDTKAEVSDFDENGNIIFADAVVKSLCVENWDTNSDGEISKTEAEAVLDLGAVFKGRKDIKSFNELRFFSGLTKIADHAFNKSSIEEIIIPSSVTSIERYAFNECANLKGELLLPESVTSIGNYAFYGCTSLTGDLDLSNVSSLGGQAFMYCSGIKGKLTLSQELTKINAQTFSHAGFTGSLVIPDSVTEIATDAFFASEGFSGTLTLGSGLTKIGTYAFVCGDVYTYYCPFNTIIARGTTPASLLKEYGDQVSKVGPFSETISGATSWGTKYNYKAPSTVYVPVGCSSIYQTRWSWTANATILEKEM